MAFGWVCGAGLSAWGCWRWAYRTGAGSSVWLGLALHPGYSAIGCLLRWAFSRRWALDAVFCALGEAWLWPCAGLHPSAGNDGLLALGSRLGAIVAGLTATVLGNIRLGSGWRLALDVGSPGLWALASRKPCWPSEHVSLKTGCTFL